VEKEIKEIMSELGVEIDTENIRSMIKEGNRKGGL